MLSIWGRANSINVMKALWAADEVGQTYERFDVGGAFGGLDTPQYKAMNPNSLVPTLQDGTLTLWESNSIVRYIAARYGAGTLWPADPVARARADQWMDWQLTTIGLPMRDLFWGYIRTAPDKRDAANLEAARQQGITVWSRLDAHLAKHAYVAGEHLTMGDIPVGAFCHRWHALPIARPDLSHLRAWYKRLCERPAYRRHVMIEMT